MVEIKWFHFFGKTWHNLVTLVFQRSLQSAGLCHSTLLYRQYLICTQQFVFLCNCQSDPRKTVVCLPSCLVSVPLTPATKCLEVLRWHTLTVLKKSDEKSIVVEKKNTLKPCIDKKKRALSEPQCYHYYNKNVGADTWRPISSWKGISIRNRNQVDCTYWTGTVVSLCASHCLVGSIKQWRPNNTSWRSKTIKQAN